MPPMPPIRTTWLALLSAALLLLGGCRAPQTPPPAEEPTRAAPTVTAEPRPVATAQARPTVVAAAPTPSPTARPTPAPATPTAAPPTAVPTAAARRPGKPTDGVRKREARRVRDQVYYLHVPRSYDGSVPLRLLVVVHGSGRSAERYAERFVDCADRQRAVVLAPLFDDEVEYQVLGVGDRERADRRLLKLVDEVAEEYLVASDRFDLYGFSGGGQFAHRFLYFHPERLRSVVIGAPGTVTLPTDRFEWPAGLGGLKKEADASVDLERVRRARIMLLVGAEDVDDEDLNESDWAMRFGDTRVERVRRLHTSWKNRAIPHTYLELRGVGHEVDRTIKPASEFLAGG